LKAIILSRPGGVDELQYQEILTPQIAPGEVLVRVKAIAINPVDVKTRTGFGIYRRLKDDDPTILGWDISGVVEEVGADVTLFQPGDEVFGMVNFPGNGRGYAEFVAAQESHLALKPANVSFQEAAASTLAALTAWQAFTQHRPIAKGERVLIHAAAGGVGHFAVQIAKYFGAYVIGTSSISNRDFLLSLGVDSHVDYKAQPFEKIVSDVDVVLDTIGGDNIDRSLQVVKPGGTLISIPSGLSESVAEKAKARSIHGFFFLVQSSGDDMRSIANLLKNGRLKAHVSKNFAFADMKQAHLDQETGRTIGKIVISI
jgi:NADPH:quinone reductase-like Zn-dependent oxidoreductase